MTIVWLFIVDAVVHDEHMMMNTAAVVCFNCMSHYHLLCHIPCCSPCIFEFSIDDNMWMLLLLLLCLNHAIPRNPYWFMFCLFVLRCQLSVDTMLFVLLVEWWWCLMCTYCCLWWAIKLALKFHMSCVVDVWSCLHELAWRLPPILCSCLFCFDAYDMKHNETFLLFAWWW